MDLPLLGNLTRIVVDMFVMAKERETFLNVDETAYPKLFFIILFSKCVVAGNGVRAIVPGIWTAVFMWLSFIFSCTLVPADHLHINIKFFLSIAMFFFLNFQNDDYPLATIGWILGVFDRKFQFFLDSYIVLTIIFWIAQKHSRDMENACKTVFYLFCLDYVCHLFVDRMDLTSLTMLYSPVLLLTSFEKFNQTVSRRLCRFVWGSAWLYYKLEKAKLVPAVTGVVLKILAASADKLLNCLPDPFRK